ncbi:DUF6624 domain-containing protein [Aquimarina sp. AU58]|uniref:DUF6624 domain-containing protein n=1 Tax=Aquimarina sp. AU58 TaxID=1874112 RepID=UPI000D6E2396|nr:DUF6624 domain-containing protein [Aquimarina sp. AU58]
MKTIKLVIILIAFTSISYSQEKKTNKEQQHEKERVLNKELKNDLVAILDTIYNTDQNQLGKIRELQNKFGVKSDEATVESKIFDENHKINLYKIEKIINEYGWLGVDSVGEQGNYTLFLIIQHSDYNTHIKYLPVLRKAVKKGNARPMDLAYLEDRVISQQGKTQIYGSQIKYYPETKSFDVWPIADPENVDKRRALIGLGPLEPHLKNRFGIVWDLEKQIERTAKFEANPIIDKEKR